MTKRVQPNYPDILGYITKDQRLNINVIEAALAVKPTKIQAGSTFEVILLLQNTSDVRVEVTAELKLPSRDAAKKPERFVPYAITFSATLLPAEVGFMCLPVTTRAEIAPSDEYRLGMELNVKPQAKPQRIRHNNEAVNLSYYFNLAESTILNVARLKGLDFSCNNAGLINTIIETTFAVAPKTEPIERVDVQPRWERLWSVTDNTDTRFLLEQYHAELQEKIIPLLERIYLFEPMYKSTLRRFAGHGYSLTPNEVHYITKLLVNILEMAHKPPAIRHYDEQEIYYVSKLLGEGWRKDGMPLPLPAWCRSLLSRIASDERILEEPVKSLSTLLYDDLVRDGIQHGFELVHGVLGRELGSRADAQKYADRFTEILRTKQEPLTFEDLYLPLILGGIIVDAEIPLVFEQPLTRLHEMLEYIQKEHRPRGGVDPEKMVVYSVTRKVCDWALQKHGYRL